MRFAQSPSLCPESLTYKCESGCGVLILIWRHCVTSAPQQPPYMFFAYCAGAARERREPPSAPCFSLCQWKLWPMQIFDLTDIHTPVFLLCVFYTNTSLLFALCVVIILFRWQPVRLLVWWNSNKNKNQINKSTFFSYNISFALFWRTQLFFFTASSLFDGIVKPTHNFFTLATKPPIQCLQSTQVFVSSNQFHARWPSNLRLVPAHPPQIPFAISSLSCQYLKIIPLCIAMA